MTFSGRLTSVEDSLCRRTTFGGRRPSVEHNLQWKMTFGGRQPSVEDDLWLKTTCSGRRPSAEDDICWSLHAASSALWHFFKEHQEHSYFLAFWGIFMTPSFNLDPYKNYGVIADLVEQIFNKAKRRPAGAGVCKNIENSGQI